jgi:hypothetical protein
METGTKIKVKGIEGTAFRKSDWPENKYRLIESDGSYFGFDNVEDEVELI